MENALSTVSIDDHADDSELLHRALQDVDRYQFDFRAFEDPTEGIAEILDKRPALVFLDMLMEPQSGLDVLRCLRRASFDGPVVMVTACERMDLAVECLKEGATDYVAKDELSADALHRITTNALRRVEMEKALRERQAELERSNHSLQRRTVRLQRVHDALTDELRLPLESVREFAELLASRTPGDLTSEQSDCLDMIRQSCADMVEQLDELVDVSRIEHASTEPRTCEAEVGKVLRAAARSVAPLAEKRCVDVRLFVQRDLPPAMMDPVRVRKLLHKILRMCVALSPLGGELSLRARRSPSFTNHVEILLEDPQASTREMESILVPAGPGGDEASSTMASARELVTKLGGWVRVEPGDPGARCVLGFPLVPPDKHTQERPQPNVLGASPGRGKERR